MLSFLITEYYRPDTDMIPISIAIWYRIDLILVIDRFDVEIWTDWQERKTTEVDSGAAGCRCTQLVHGRMHSAVKEIPEKDGAAIPAGKWLTIVSITVGEERLIESMMAPILWNTNAVKLDEFANVFFAFLSVRKIAECCCCIFFPTIACCIGVVEKYLRIYVFMSHREWLKMEN